MARLKGQGQLAQKGNNWYLILRKNGKPTWHAIGCQDKLEAEIRADILIEAMERGANKAKAKREACGLALKDAWKVFKARIPCGKETLRAYEAKWQKFLTWTRQQKIKRMEDINADQAREYAVWLMKKVPASVSSYINGASRVWDVCGMETNPWRCVIKPRVMERPRREGFSTKELEAISRVLEDPAIECLHKQEMKLAHLVGLNTGLRMEDVSLLRWSSVDLENRLVSVIPEKTKRFNRSVVIPMSDELFMALSFVEKTTEWVMPSLEKRYRANPSGISQDYTWLLKQAGIQTSSERCKGRKAQVLKSFHSLRHTFVSRLAESGASPLIIQSMSGHSTYSMTERYSHIGVEAKRKALAGMGCLSKTADASPLNAKLEAVKVLLQGRKDNPLATALLALLEHA